MFMSNYTNMQFERNVSSVDTFYIQPIKH